MKDRAKIVNLVYGVAFLCASVVLAVLLVLQVCDIYFHGGNSPYTVATIEEHFFAVSPALYVWIALAVAGFIVGEIFPTKVNKGKNDIAYTFARIEGRLSSKKIDGCEESDLYKKYALVLTVTKFAVGVCVGICAVFSLVFLLDGKNFPNADQNGEVARAALYLLPFVAVSFALVIGVAIFEKYVVGKRLPLAKKLLAQATEEREKGKIEIFKQKVKSVTDNKYALLTVRISVAVVGTVLFVYGLATGGNAHVLAKAITICRQCIGLG